MTEQAATAINHLDAFKKSRQILPSILSADFAQLGSQVAEVMDAGAKVIHIDVMDGQFVPPITIGPLIVEAIADQVKRAGGMLDVHLMIENPERQIEAFAKAGADAISFHVEATAHAHRIAGAIRELDCLAGAVLNPSTPVSALAHVGDELDYAVCMSVNPGWGGQSFIEASSAKLALMRAALPLNVVLEVDGGVDKHTATEVAAAGAMLLVVGSAIFKSHDPAQAFRDIAQAAGA